MNKKIFPLIALLIFSTVNAFSQDAKVDEKSNKDKELKDKAIVLLRETRNEVNGLRTIENRISFNSELADLMWFYNEDEAKKMFENVVFDFTQLLSRYNSELNFLGGVKDEEELWRGRISPTDKTRAIMRLSKAVVVRQQIAMALAAHDAEAAYQFVSQTSQLVTDETFKKQIEQQNAQLETAIIEFMANQDVDKALALARKALKIKFRTSMLGLAEKVYAKDKDKGLEFASEIIAKVLSEVKEKDVNFQSVEKVLTFHSDLKPGEKPIFSESSRKELAESFADVLIRAENIDEIYRMDSYVEAIERFSPSSANRLRNKFKDEIVSDALTPVDRMREAGRRATEEAKVAARDAVDKVEEVSKDDVDSNAEDENEEFLENLKDGKLKDLPEEEKKKFIEEAQKILASTSNPTEKIMGLSGLAMVVKQLGDDEFASQLMGEASQLVTSQPKTYLDFMQVWTLASGYALVDAEKSFPILDDVVFRLNDTIEAFVKVAEFIDVSEDMIIDNEVQLGSFGGAMTRGLIGSLKNSDTVLRSMAENDFEKTKSLADRFSRREVRIMAKMLIMRSVLDDGKNKVSFEGMDYMGFE